MTRIPQGIDPAHLYGLLTAAGIVLDGLVIEGDEAFVPGSAPPGQVGERFDLPAGSEAVIAAYVPPDPIKTNEFKIEKQVTTTNGGAVVLYRGTIPVTSIFDIVIRVYAVDRVNGNFKKFRREAAIRRLGQASAPAVMGTVETPAPDVGTATWTIVPSFVGNDLVITVTGAATRTIDWSLFAEVRRFSPGEAL